MKNFIRLFYCIFFMFVLCFESCFGQKIKYDIDSKRIMPLPREIENFLEAKKLDLTIGIAVIKLDREKHAGGFYRYYTNNRVGDSLGRIKTSVKFPTMSVYKFHLALAILKEVDKGKFDLNDKLLITKYDLLENTYSPLREDLKKEYGEKYKDKTDFSIKLNELLSYMVSKSDNNACDILFRLLGGKEYFKKSTKNFKNNFSEFQIIKNRKKYNQKGVEKTNKFIQKLGLKHTTIAASEEKMHEAFDNQYLNTTTPLDAVSLLKHFYQNQILKKETHDFLWKIMVETQTGGNKIKAGLPKDEEIVLGHKTGSSFRKEPQEGQEFGLKAAENDIGIVLTPTKSYAIAIFIKNSNESNEVNNALIAELSKMIYEFLD